MNPKHDRHPRRADGSLTDGPLTDGPLTPGARNVAGCPPGTVILTRDGEIPVEYLTPGDRIITRGAGYATLLELERRCLVTGAVRIAAGAFGPSRPARDIILPDTQQVLLRELHAMPRAGALADGVRVTRIGPVSQHLFALGFARAQVIYADGLELACGVASAPGRRAA